MAVLKQNEVFAGRYQLGQLLGEGGFSEVWMAHDLMADDTVVAIKIYAPNKELDDESLRQSRNEFALTYPLTHPHLLKMNHFDVADGSPYLIMPYCPYGSLAHVLRTAGVFTERQAALVMCQIGSALEEIHRQDPPIIHQDIKPDNILLLNPESFLLADFGISSRIRHSLHTTTTNMQALTIAYAPPERFGRDAAPDPSSDIFSLGVTLYEMCTNTLPWEGTGGEYLQKGARIPVLPANFSTEFNEILQDCMSTEPAVRPTAQEIHQKGKCFIETGQWHMPRQVNRRLPINKALASSLTAAAVLLLTIAGFGFYKVQDSKPAIKPQEVITSTVVADKIASPPELEKAPKKTEPPVSKPKQQAQLKNTEKKSMEQKEEAQAATPPAPVAKRTEVLAVSQKSDRSPAKTNAAYANHSRKTKNPASKTKKSKYKKKKPLKELFKKLKN